VDRESGLSYCGPTDPEVLKRYWDPGGLGLLGFRSGALGLVSLRAPYILFELELQGDKGLVRVSQHRSRVEVWRAEKSHHLAGFQELVKEEFPAVEERSPILCAVDEIVRCLDRGERSVSSGEDGRAALEVALAFHEAQRVGRPVRLPLPRRGLRILTR
jgi:predicted dehydrogenase